jgi:ketosteroid isomerase-like protein
MTTFGPEIIWDTTRYHNWPESEYHGLEGVERFFTEWLEVWDDYEARVEDIIPTRDGRVVVLFSHRGKGRTSGLRMEDSPAQVITVRDGRIIHIAAYDSRAEALATAGLAE